MSQVSSCSPEVEWISRKRQREPSDKVEVFLPSLNNASMLVDPDMLKCVACSELLPRNFVTLKCSGIAYHSLCGDCAHSCTKNHRIKCPLCRSFSPDMGHQHPIILDCMKNHPRPARCGVSCAGWDKAALHMDTCITCYKLYVVELQNELSAVKVTNRNLMNKTTRLEEETTRLQEEIAYRADTETDDDSDN